MRTRSLLVLMVIFMSGCGARISLQSASSPLPRVRHALAQTSQSLPAWMTACLASDGVTATEPAAGSTPQLTSTAVVGVARATDTLLATMPATAAYLQYTPPAVNAGTVSGDALSTPLWAVGFTGLHWQLPGLNYSATSTAAEPYMSGLVVFIDDATSSPVLQFDCPS